MRKLHGKSYQSIILYGIGQYYEEVKEELFQQVKPDYLCDRKWDVYAPDSYDGIPIMKREELSQLGNCLVIVTTGVPWTEASIKSDLEHLTDVTVVHVNEFLGRRIYVTGKILKEEAYDGCYQDSFGNRIYFDAILSNGISVVFYGRNNELIIGSNVMIGEMTVSFGNGGFCKIGDGAEIIGGYFAVSGAKLEIERDSLISTNVVMQNHDGTPYI